MLNIAHSIGILISSYLAVGAQDVYKGVVGGQLYGLLDVLVGGSRFAPKDLCLGTTNI